MKYTRAIRRKRKALFQSIMSLILCFAMLTGTTFAWFSDSASSEGNIIQSGGLDVKLEYKKNFTDSWSDASNAVIFNYDQWEPGYSDVRYLQISNDGNLAFQYQITVEPVVTNPGTTGQEGTAGTQPNSGETASTQTDPGQNDPVAEAAENGKSIFKHDRRGKVAEAYTALSKEVNRIGREAYRSRSDGAR